MCGIAGLLAPSSLGRVSSVLKSMAGAIAHRGPDDEGFFVKELNTCDLTVGLAHRRLSIIDLDAGHQPIGNEDGSIQVVFNGEIYNYQLLRKELIGLGHQFKTASDTETIVHAYEEYGDQCVEHFRGMFSFAIWDSTRERLFLARDRFGKKPLFYCKTGNSFLFASEIKSILQFPDIKKTVNRDAVWEYLSYRYVPGPNTLFQDIKKLQPGSCLVWEKGELTNWSYYTPPDCFNLNVDTALGDVVGGFLDKLDEAVRIRMVSDVPFGAFLSGGIDSSAIVALMSRYSEFPVKTFSVGFSESKYSELGYAKTIADQFKTEHYELKVSQDNLMDELPRLVRFRDAPISEPSDIPIYLLSKEARKTVKMVLTGEGSDEFLGGYPKHVFERYAGIYQLVPSILRSGLMEPLVQSLPYRFRRVKTAVHNLGLDDWQERMAGWFGAMSSKERELLVGHRLGHMVNMESSSTNCKNDNTALRKILCFDQTSWLPDNLLERGDRMTMAASLEGRMPFMDHELSAYVSALPDNFRVRGSTTKWILREAMKRLLPLQILERPKVGFRVPVNEWFQGPMKDYLFDHLTSSSSCTSVYYNKVTLNKLLKEHVNGRQNHEKLLWSLLNLEIWHNEYNIAP
jgi:asparagine synthase (glutamine-hydrolysing)